MLSIPILTYEQCAELVPLCIIEIHGTRVTSDTINGVPQNYTSSIFTIDLDITELLRIHESQSLESKHELEKAFEMYESESSRYDCAILTVKKEVLIPYEEIKIIIVQRIQELFPNFFLTSDCRLSVHFAIKHNNLDYKVGEFKDLGIMMYRDTCWANLLCALVCPCILLCCVCSRSCITYRDFTPKQNNILYYKAEQVDKPFWKDYIEQHVTQENFKDNKW